MSQDLKFVFLKRGCAKVPGENLSEEYMECVDLLRHAYLHLVHWSYFLIGHLLADLLLDYSAYPVAGISQGNIEAVAHPNTFLICR